jgi:hypothetical protein
MIHRICIFFFTKNHYQSQQSKTLLRLIGFFLKKYSEYMGMNTVYDLSLLPCSKLSLIPSRKSAVRAQSNYQRLQFICGNMHRQLQNWRIFDLNLSGAAARPSHDHMRHKSADLYSTCCCNRK